MRSTGDHSSSAAKIPVANGIVWISVSNGVRGMKFGAEPKWNTMAESTSAQAWIADATGELAGFDYDNPTSDPLSGAALRNTLIVNGTAIPPGTKVTPLK